MADYRKRLANRVRHEREKQQWSRDELALRANLNPKTIERIEEAEVDNPRGNTIRSLAEALNLEPAELNPPPELEEERLQRLEEKIDEALDLLRRLALDQDAEDVERLADEASAEVDEPGEQSQRTPGAASG